MNKSKVFFPPYSPYISYYIIHKSLMYQTSKTKQNKKNMFNVNFMLSLIQIIYKHILWLLWSISAKSKPQIRHWSLMTKQTDIQCEPGVVWWCGTHGGILISSAGVSQDSLYEPAKAVSAGPPHYAEESPRSGHRERSTLPIKMSRSVRNQQKRSLARLHLSFFGTQL